MVKFILNNVLVETDSPASLSLLDYLRKQLYLTGTKESCHQGECGACLVLLGERQQGQLHYKAIISCLLPLGELQGKHVVTIEGLNQSQLSPLQQVFVDNGAVQCGYCTPGFIIALTEFLLNAKTYTLEEAKLAVSNNLCRCTGYQSIKRAVIQLIKNIKKTDLENLIALGFIPDYFIEIPQRLHALATLTSLPVAESIALGGGTDFFVQHHDTKAPLEFLSSHQELKGIHIQEGYCYVGAETTLETLRCSPVIKSILPSLEDDLKLFAAKPLRQRATLAGNLVNASPIADVSIILLSLNAELELIINNKSHCVDLKDFFIGYKQIAKESEELIKSIKIPLPLGLFHYQKVSKRQYLDIASVNSAIQITVTDNVIQQVHLAVGGLAATPLYLQQSVVYLHNKTLDADTIKNVLKIAQAEVSPISDIRGSCDYKRLLLQQILIGHFLALFPKHLNWQDLQFQGVLQ